MRIERIDELTKRINDALHKSFGMTDLQDRMLFAACALVAIRFKSQDWLKGLKSGNYIELNSEIAKVLEEHKEENGIPEILEEFASIRIDIKDDGAAIDDCIDAICETAEMVNADDWKGTDVMAVFFNEFTRFRGKSDAGQVFTPDHIASFMYRLIGVQPTDRVLDPTCGSGTLIVKAMSKMLADAAQAQIKSIKQEQIYGIEYMRKVYALSCANFLLYKDGKANIIQADAKSKEAADWIRSKNITKVIANPPYERKYGCADIVCNILDSVPAGTQCAILLPDKKIEKEPKLKKALQRHTLTTIVKMPENLFFGVGVTTSIFVFETGIPQNGRKIIGYNMEDDGLETVKNQGRKDIRNKWPEIEDYWINAIKDNNEPTRQEIDPAEHQSYQMPEKPFEIYEESFAKTMLDYELFKRGIDQKEFEQKVLSHVLYSSQMQMVGNTIVMVWEVNADD